MSGAQPQIVHPVELEDVPSWLRAMATGFHEDAGGGRVDRWAQVLARLWEPERAWGARDRDRWVATLRTETRTLTVPGLGDATRALPVNALTNVTVSATHRRRGLMSTMLDDALRAARAQRDSVSVLISAEWPIYGRFGYAPAAWSASYVLHRGRRGSTVAGDLTRVRASDRDEIAAVGPSVFAGFARRRAGQIDRDHRWWSVALGTDGFPAPAEEDALPHAWIVHEGSEGVDGLAGWRATRHGNLNPPHGRIDVWGLFAASDAAERDLWSCVSGLDLIDEVVLSHRPVDEPIRWLLADGRSLVLDDCVDYLWLRLLDVEAALASRRYGVAGELVLDVYDDAPATEIDVSGRYGLRADDDAVQCARSNRPADLRISQRALASMYLGGVSPAELLTSGAITELTAGALERARLMFSTSRPPWNATGF